VEVCSWYRLSLSPADSALVAPVKCTTGAGGGADASRWHTDQGAGEPCQEEYHSSNNCQENSQAKI